MRIIAGTAKGMKLAAPEGIGSRPVLDRVKESWFAVLGSRAEAGGVEDAHVLDLYSGVGSLGL
ncbi:MAG: RsmD family RNA methyltransferase, partial [Planctomycetota bacterium]